MSYLKDLGRMLILVQRDHGGCEEDDCSLRISLEDDYDPMEAIKLWAWSGAACEEFNRLHERHEKRLRKDGAA